MFYVKKKYKMCDIYLLKSLFFPILLYKRKYNKIT